MILIIDEWLWHDLAGENREEKQKEAFRFLECIFKICDKIAIMENSPFIKKFWHFLNALPPEMIKFFKNYFLFNSDKCKLVDYTDKYTLIGIKPDDLYLYNLCYVLEKENDECIIITTDKPLIEVLKKQGLKVKHRDEYLKGYFIKCHV
jgi:hypothetical protein